MKIVESIIKFIFSLIKSVILVGIICGVMLFALLVFTIFVPEQVTNAFEILNSLFGS